MPKHAVNVTEQNKIRKLFEAGNSAEAIAAHMNVDLPVVQAWHPDNVKAVREENRQLEVAAAEERAEQETAELEEAAKKAKASERAKKAAATRKANQAAKREEEAVKDRKLAEERDKAQQALREGATIEG